MFRSILKPRHEDAELFKEKDGANDVTCSRDKSDAMYGAVQDGPLNIDRMDYWDDFDGASKDPWTVEDEESLENSL